MVSVVMVSVVMLSVIMLIVVAPSVESEVVVLASPTFEKRTLDCTTLTFVTD